MGLPDSIRREFIYIAAVARTLRLTRNVRPDVRFTVADWIERWARERPSAPAILFENRTVSWAEFDAGANRFARWAVGLGLAKGDTVSLLMENCPEYLMAWIGLAKVGCVSALINTHLVGHPLAQSIAIASAKHLILGKGLEPHLRLALQELDAKPLVWALGGRTEGAEDLDGALAAQSDAPMPKAARENLFCRDKALYIFTSGTTGLPKAANMTHMRLLHILSAFQGAVNATEYDRMYNVLPLYHTAGGIAALGPPFLSGGSVVIRDRFSASEFWDDCHRYRPTVFQYIGELCRYLLNQPERAHERDHRLKIAIGNGLRPDIWARFQERFAIPRIMEFYGATEGNVGMINYDGKQGAIGRVPWYARGIQKIRLLRYDHAAQQPLRNADGFCSETADGEIGEACGKIDANDPRSRFDGYTGKSETEKKILRDVFAKGDAWFRTGDLMRRDEAGYFYFVDRTGDTFRWKGENVSTSEVAEILSAAPGVAEANVYGVEVPGSDGRAGMAALVTTRDFDLDRFARHIDGELPAYAQPVFLRTMDTIATTSTFKQRKIELQKEGFDPASIENPLYVRDADSERYRPLTPALYAEICAGALKL